MKCVKFFLSDRITTIRLGEWESQAKSVRCGIPQRSVLSPILFLFFNVNLLDAYQSPAQKIISMGFVDDVNLLTYGRSTKENCKRLEAMQKICEQWARRHDARFEPTKYELIHLTKTPKKFNIEEPVRIDGANV